MAILIDIDMPEECGKCCFLNAAFFLNPRREKVCSLEGRNPFNDTMDISRGRPYWCPLREVVRCKVCKYYKQINPNSGYGLCHRDLVATSWPKDGFCSRGERREE